MKVVSVAGSLAVWGERFISVLLAIVMYSAESNKALRVCVCVRRRSSATSTTCCRCPATAPRRSRRSGTKRFSTYRSEQTSDDSKADVFISAHCGRKTVLLHTGRCLKAPPEYMARVVNHVPGVILTSLTSFSQWIYNQESQNMYYQNMSDIQGI